MDTTPSMNAAQEKAFATINDNWPIASWTVEADGVHFECDDGDKGIIEEDGTWDWT